MKRRLSQAQYEQLLKDNPDAAAQYRQVKVQAPIVKKQFISPAELEKLQRENPEEAATYRPMKAVTIEQIRQMKIGRNERCPCKSGKKFKKCCLGK